MCPASCTWRRSVRWQMVLNRSRRISCDAGVALAYRLTESIKSFPQWSVFGEASYVWLGKDDAGGDEGINNNSGGNTLYLTPGLRVRFSENTSLTVAPSFPAWQDLQGDQIKSQVKLAVTFTYAF